MHQRMAGLVLAGLLLAALGASASAAPSGLSPEQLIGLARLSDPRISPDTTQAAYVRSQTDLAANKGHSSIWLAPVDGHAAPKRLTGPGDGDNSQPRWVPDGTALYFISSRSGTNQIWLQPLDGGAARQITDLPLDADHLTLSPTGRHIAFTMEVFADCPTPQCTADRLAAAEKSPETGLVHQRLFIRHWNQWKDGRRRHLFVQSLDGGAPVNVSAVLDGDVAAAPFGGAADIAFAPDGQSIVFAARLAADDEVWTTNYDLYRAPADGSAPPVNLTPGNKAMDLHPVFTPDGRSLAYIATAVPGYESAKRRIMVMDLATGKATPLNPDWDRSVDGFAFLPAGNIIVAKTQDMGQRRLWAISRRSGAATKLTGDGYVQDFDLVKNQIVYLSSGLGAPADLYATRANGSRHKRLTSANKDALQGVALAEYEQFSFPGWGNETVHGYAMKPVGFQEGVKYPLVYVIHGGPQSSFANVWHTRWNAQVLAAAGYGVVFIDFHGSTGYGQAFTDSITGDWGGKPLVDWQRGLDAALARYDWLDGGRVCAMGGSYGGYAVNWIAGQWPDRFNCLINHAGVFDLRAMYYETEELWFIEHDFGGPYFSAPDNYERFNPVAHAGKWQTPMLVIHGALDYRVPDTQAIATFTALQRRGIPSKLLYFPDEGHHIAKPANALQWHQTVLDWLARWLKSGETQ